LENDLSPNITIFIAARLIPRKTDYPIPLRLDFEKEMEVTNQKNAHEFNMVFTAISKLHLVLSEIQARQMPCNQQALVGYYYFYEKLLKRATKYHFGWFIIVICSFYIRRILSHNPNLGNCNNDKLGRKMFSI
jgi:hypothetical protein